jgi:hypothetical protein
VLEPLFELLRGEESADDTTEDNTENDTYERSAKKGPDAKARFNFGT